LRAKSLLGNTIANDAWPAFNGALQKQYNTGIKQLNAEDTAIQVSQQMT